MASSTSVKFRDYKYVLEWTFESDDSDKAELLEESPVIYVGARKKSAWCMQLIYGANGYAELRMVFVGGCTLSAECVFEIEINNHRIKIIKFSRKQFTNRGDYFGDQIYTSLIGKVALVCHMIYENEEGISYRPRIEEMKRMTIDIRHLLDDDKTKDISVVSKEGKEFRAHKNILTARSDVFAAMFQHDMQEKLNNEVRIEDISGEVLKEMLIYIYSGDLSIWNFDLALDLFVIGDKYKIHGLKELCSNFLSLNISVEFVTRTFILADKHNDRNLKDTCKFFVARNAPALQKTADWSVLLKEHSDLVTELILMMASKDF